MASDRVRRGQAVWRCAPGYLTVAVADGRSVEVGGSGAAVWNLLPNPDDAPVAIAELVSALAAEFAVSADVLRGDVDEVIDALEALGAAVRHP